MPHVSVAAAPAGDLREMAERRWSSVLSARPDLEPAVSLQRRLLTLVLALSETLTRAPAPRLSLPAKYVAAKLTRGVPALAGEPIPLPQPLLTPTLLALCSALADGGAGDAARHIRDAIESGNIESGSLLAASLTRDQAAIRTGAAHRGLAPDLVWLVAELAVGPYVHALQRRVFGATDEALAAAMQRWDRGHCPACGSWPAIAEVVGGHRVLRCSFCAAAWEMPSYCCIYCGETGERFVTAAPDDARKDRRLEVCSACGGYLKTIDLPELSPFPLLSISDLETTDLDIAAMEHGYQRPALKEFSVRK